ncbi:Plasmodium exported protein, unknown function [Plasmodium ovale wallikeri]|uniref:Uncharacterized protein n=2 Tax=Plasmodium ovale TaxID=36330 RepID=A0A1A9AJ81_PLAOA|nr:Plasmodium exported protein, unknown function [Plasmodium ovale wallikeri]SBT56154.1 Plasmodium exported protein, unknown function [Plasmodium ovale wallikeri]SBT73280.1 Plasmodium exported protein, unknown function [Plasmodium ovale]
MLHYKPFIFTFLIWAWENTKNCTLNNGNDTQNFGARAGRILYQYERMHNENSNGVAAQNNPQNINNVYGNDFFDALERYGNQKNSIYGSQDFNFSEDDEVMFEGAKNISSGNGESLLVDILGDNNNFGRINGKADAAKNYQKYLTNFDEKEEDVIDYLDIIPDEIVTHKLKDSNAREKRIKKKVPSKRNISKEQSGNSFQGYFNEYEKYNLDDNNFDVNHEEIIDGKINDLILKDKSTLRNVLTSQKEDNKKAGTKSRNSTYNNYPGYLLNYKRTKRDDENFELDHDAVLTRKMREFNEKDKEILKNVLGNNKEKKKMLNKLGLNKALKSEIKNNLKKTKNRENDMEFPSDDEVVFDEMKDINPKEKMLLENAFDVKSNNSEQSMEELRSYIDSSMDEENAAIAHTLVNEIDKYRNKIANLKIKQKKETKFLRMKHKYNVKRIMLYIPLISLITSIILGIIIGSFGYATVAVSFGVSVLSFVLGTVLSYGVLGKVLFGSVTAVVRLILGNRP